eukprot:167646_1
MTSTPIKYNYYILLLAYLRLKSSIGNEFAYGPSNDWTAIAGVWTYDLVSFVQTESATNIAELVKTDTQWYNADGVLTIDYTFSVSFGDYSDFETATSGITLYNGRAASFCEFYFIAFHFDNQYPSSYQVVLMRGNAPNQIQTVVVGNYFAFEQNKDYTLSVHVYNGNAFTIFVDNVQHISGVDNYGYTTLTNGFSGYFSIYATEKIITTAKYLSISGTPQNVPTFVIDISSNCVSLSPTPSTTHPSAPPSDHPTYTPSTMPSAVPTVIPSPSPSSIPSTLPSNMPTIQATISPTLNPTDIPSFSPSVDPTRALTVIPSASPSRHPSAYPSVHPTHKNSRAYDETLTAHPDESEENKQRNGQPDEGMSEVWIIMVVIAGCLLLVSLVCTCVIIVWRTRNKTERQEIEKAELVLCNKGQQAVVSVNNVNTQSVHQMGEQVEGNQLMASEGNGDGDIIHEDRDNHVTRNNGLNVEESGAHHDNHREALNVMQSETEYEIIMRGITVQ